MGSTEKTDGQVIAELDKECGYLDILSEYAGEQLSADIFGDSCDGCSTDDCEGCPATGSLEDIERVIQEETIKFARNLAQQCK